MGVGDWCALPCILPYCNKRTKAASSNFKAAISDLDQPLHAEIRAVACNTMASLQSYEIWQALLSGQMTHHEFQTPRQYKITPVIAMRV